MVLGDELAGSGVDEAPVYQLHLRLRPDKLVDLVLDGD
jgi:hypothetical protein